MRTIKFRGYSKDTKKWYYGNLLVLDETTYCFKEDYEAHPDNIKYFIVFSQMTDWGLPNQVFRAEVDKDSVGQFTGLYDKNGKEIYEGDIVKLPVYIREYAGLTICKWLDNKKNNRRVFRPVVGFGLENLEGGFVCADDLEDSEVVGNIYENKELLEAEE